jgi:hypothetical protein
MRSSLSIALLAAALAAPAHAQASDFTITIPVSFSGLPSNITQFGVSCYVMPEDFGTAANQVAYGGARINVSGSYSGNMTISFNAGPGRDPSTARWYRCAGQFYSSDHGRETTYFPNGQIATPNFPLVSGATFNLGYNATRYWTRIPGR